ncbi:MAG: alpha/beta hydrolase [Roseivivax sp.]|nr:alpha/beta hydrolase [Roseivivax sp.]
MKTVYLSAFPGSAAELELTRLAHLTTLPRTGDAEAMARALPAREVHLVGFSLGAVAALRIASRAPGQVVRVTAISPVAPAALGGAVPAFATATGMLAKLSPGLGAGGAVKQVAAAEPALFDDPAARGVLKQVMSEGLGDPALARERAAWAEPWEAELAAIRCQVSLWRGEADRFTTAQQVTAMARAIRYAEVNWVPRAGHFGALAEVMQALARLPDLR